MVKKRFGILGSFIMAGVLVAMLFPIAAYADITTVCRLSGPVTLDGANVAPDTLVTAAIDGVTGSPWTGRLFEHFGVTWYVVDIPPDDTATPAKDGGADGDTISFTVTIAGTPIPWDTDSFQMTSFKYHALALSSISLIVTTTALPDGRIRTPYQTSLTVTGGIPPYNWTAVGLPPGLSLSGNGVITGTPAASGNYNISFSVTSSMISPLTAVKVLPLTVWLQGDANGDGVVNMTDATYTELIILGLRPIDLGADANMDGVVNMTDFTVIELIILGLYP